jgi:hypothetical protein
MKLPKEIRDLLRESWASVSSEKNNKMLKAALSAYERTQNKRTAQYKPNIWRMILWSKAGYLAASFLVIASLIISFVLYKKVVDLKSELKLAQLEINHAHTDNTTTINLYLKEHRDVVARHVFFNPTAPQPAQMRVSQEDILYFEFFDDGPEYMHPGIIVRGSSSERKISPPEAPVISDGHTLSLSEARQAAGFDLVSPLWFHPGYSLDQIRRIEDRDALQLLYTDGISTVSLFEQPLDGQRVLTRQDFREYAVYRNAKQSGGTILAWRDDELSYVLIGNIDMSQLMDMAQSISAGK